MIKKKASGYSVHSDAKEKNSVTFSESKASEEPKKSSSSKSGIQGLAGEQRQDNNKNVFKWFYVQIKTVLTNEGSDDWWEEWEQSYRWLRYISKVGVEWL